MQLTRKHFHGNGVIALKQGRPRGWQAGAVVLSVHCRVSDDERCLERDDNDGGCWHLLSLDGLTRGRVHGKCCYI